MQKPSIDIRYCTGCHWLLRAAWFAQELLSTFEQDLAGVTLIPDSTGGVFEIHVDGTMLWSRKAEGRFPEIKEIKQKLRDIVDPDRDLGHVDS